MTYDNNNNNNNNRKSSKQSEAVTTIQTSSRKITPSTGVNALVTNNLRPSTTGSTSTTTKIVVKPRITKDQSETER